MTDMRALLRSTIPLLVLLFLVQPVTAQDPTPEPVIGRVQGMVENLTADAEPPAGVSVNLFALEGFEPAATYTGTVASGGGFEFQDVALVEGRSYIVTLAYKGVSYGSAFAPYDGIGDSLELDLEVYEPTDDVSVISVSRMHIFVDFSGDNLQISELYLFDNLSDRVYVGSTGVPEDGTLELVLPPGAIGPLVERAIGESMVPTTSSVFPTAEGFIDTQHVRPGMASQQLMVTYQLPYDGNQATISHPLSYPVQRVSLFVPDVGLAVESDQLGGGERQTLSGMPMLLWDGANLAAGDLLSFRISGEPDFSGLATESEMPGPVIPGSPNPHVAQPSVSPLFVSSGDNPVTWAIGAGVLIVGAGLVGYFWTRRTSAPEVAPVEELLQAIVALDAAYEAGEIPTAPYEWERERLKIELRRWYAP
jgi:hypothetical protein